MRFLDRIRRIAETDETVDMISYQETHKKPTRLNQSGRNVTEEQLAGYPLERGVRAGRHGGARRAFCVVEIRTSNLFDQAAVVANRRASQCCWIPSLTVHLSST